MKEFSAGSAGAGLTDDELVKRFASGDENSDSAFTALANRYIGLIRSITSKYRVSGLEPDDLTQEGLLGFLDAVKTYSAEKSASFRTYAGVCIDNRFKTLLKKSESLKRKALNTSVPLDENAIGEVAGSVDPENMYIGKESVSALRADMARIFTQLEQKVLNRYLAGESYKDIARELSIEVKSVDNAMRRVRKKLRDHISGISL